MAVGNKAIAEAVLHAHEHYTSMEHKVPTIAVVRLLKVDLHVSRVSHALHQPDPKYPKERQHKRIDDRL